LAGWDDVGYSFLVCEDGRVYEGRGWNVRGAHTLGYNQVAIGVCIIGDYQRRLPLPPAVNATQELLACGVDQVSRTIYDKKISYRRVTARCVVSVEILPITTQQCRNYLYDKS